jgi:putative sterol carrier protein
MAGYETKEQMQAVVERFLVGIEKSEDLANRCKGINVSIGYEIIDLDLQFHTEFMDGVVTGGIGEASPPSMVFLETDSETFDGMMTGEIDGASAAMSGALSFSGDMSAAMGLQALQDDMNQIYRDAKAGGVG